MSKFHDSLNYLDTKVNSRRYNGYHQCHFGRTEGKKHLPKIHSKDEFNKTWSEVPLE